MKARIVLLSFFIFSFLCFSEDTQKTLFEKSKAKCVIAVADDAGPVIKAALEELKSYLEKIGKDKVDIIKIPKSTLLPLSEFANKKTVILLGDSYYVKENGINTQSLPGDGFVIKTIPEGLIIAGKDDSIFSYNYDWIPASAGTLYGVYRFLEKLGCRWYLPIPVGEIIPLHPTLNVPELNISDAPYFEYRFAFGHYNWRRKVGYGGTVDPWSTRHTLAQTVDFINKYKNTHPEYFSPKECGIALRHPGVTEAVANEAINYFANSKLPEGKKYFAVNPTDAWPGGKCELCKKLETPERGEEGTLSDYVGGAVIDVAQRVKAKGINYPLVYCAYEKYLLPPENIKNLPDNVVVQFACNRCSFYDPALRNEMWQIISMWGKLNPKRFYFYRYSRNFCKLTPSFAPHMIAEDIKEMKSYREKGKLAIGGEMDFGVLPENHPYIWWFALNEYVTGKLLWNPDLNVDDVLDDFYTNFFGPDAAVPMKKFFSRLEELYMNSEERYVYSINTLNYLDNLLKVATDAGKKTEYEQRIKYIKDSFDIVLAMRQKLEDGQQTSENPVPFMIITGDSLPFREEKSGKILESKDVLPVEGINGQAMQFSGKGSFVRLPYFNLNSTDYSVEMWIKPDDVTFLKKQYLLGCNLWDRHILAINNGQLLLQHRVAAANYEASVFQLAAPNAEFKPGVWAHVVATFSRKSGMALYINGALCAIDIVKNTSPQYNDTLYLLGAGGKSGINDLNGFWKGAIDEVRIYRCELSLREIKDSYNKYSIKQEIK